MLVFGLGWAMTPLGLVLFARQVTGSFARASVVVGSLLVGNAVFSPLRGRWIDTRGVRTPLPVMAAVACAGLIALVVAGEAGAPLAPLAALTFVAGAGIPPVGAALRTLFAQLVDDDEHLHAAYALFNLVNETTLFSGPLLAGLVLVIASPAAVIVCAAVLVLVAALSFALAPGANEWRGVERSPTLSRFGPLAGAGMRTVIICGFGFGMAFGELENIALPAFAKAHHATPAAGLLLAAIALGIGSGSLVYGLRSSRRSAGERYPALCVLGLPAFALTPFVDAIPPMLVVMLILGLLFAPALVTVFAVVDEVAPVGTATESITWLSSLAAAGTAVGAIVAGLLVHGPGVHAAFAGAAVAAGAATAYALLRRRTLSA
ncbi:MAG TPA: MFS transporter [Thermoleophilaceae bacterium]|nr:MFS transporter [Thermoleophilaceae bacterium]